MSPNFKSSGFLLILAISKSTIMKLSDIKAALKPAGLRTISLTIDSFHSKTFRDLANKTQQGMRGGSTGPMTMTSAHLDHDKQTEEKAKEILAEIGCTIEPVSTLGFNATFVQDNGKPKTIKFRWDLYPTYHHSADLDSSYKTNWLVMTSN